MKFHKAVIAFFMLLVAGSSPLFCSFNQTDTVSPIIPADELPFTVTIQQTGFSLPVGLQAYVWGEYNGKILLLAGRLNGLHGFSATPDNFPPNEQNTYVWVIDFAAQSVVSKSLFDATAFLTQAEIDSLAVTDAQAYTNGNTLYMIGGYGFDTALGTFSTKACLTAINIPGLINWVVNGVGTARQNIRQTFHPLLQVTGGSVDQITPHSPTLLVFGQNFEGYYLPSSNGEYTQQVRCFTIVDNGSLLYILPQESEAPNPNYRRRDLNVVPIIQYTPNALQQRLVALSGVFTIPGGIWTVPVTIDDIGHTFMPDPNSASTFKQGMNNYACPAIGLYSNRSNDMYIILPGGLTYGYFDDGDFLTDDEVPFTNQITTIKIDQLGHYQQYLMDSEYPVIPSTGTNPGNPLLFGTAASFFPNKSLPTFPNGVLQLDNLGPSPVLLGYIIGGIQSTLPNTNTMADSAASPYVFEVILTPRS